MLAVVMVNVGNHRGNGIEYANRLRSDILKHLAVPHRVYCYSDQPACFFARTRCKPHPAGQGAIPHLRQCRPGTRRACRCRRG